MSEWKIIREANDPIALRLSVGGKPDKFGYIVHRGETADCLRLLKEAVAELEKHLAEQGE